MNYIEAMKQALEALIQARKIRFAQWRNGCDCESEHTCNPLEDSYANQFNDAIIKLEQAITEAKQKPVEWCSLCGREFQPPQPKEEQEPVAWYYEIDGSKAISFAKDGEPNKPWQRLYTHPQPKANQCTRSHPHENMDAMCELRTEIARLTNQLAHQKAEQEPKREWVGLSVFEINDLVENTEYEDYENLVERVEAKLKEKNT